MSTQRPWRIYKNTPKGWVAMKRRFTTRAKAYRAFIDRNLKSATHLIKSDT